MSGRLLLVLVMGTALGSLGQTAQDVTTVRAAVAKIETLARKVSKSHSTQGRRLMPDIDFGKLCTSKCWADVKTSMIKMVGDMEKNCKQNMMADPECDKSKQGDGSGEPSNEEPDGPDPCLFDMGKMNFGGDLGTLADVCTKGIVKTMGPDTPYKMDLCTLGSFDFICDAILGSACTADNTQERKLFCAAPSADDEPDDPPDCDNPPPSGTEAMAENFNQMCAYNPTGKFYCQQEAAAWEAKGAFKDEPEVIFPNPCDIDCNKPTGKAIAAMGCCLGTLISASEKHGMMSKKALRSAKAAVFKCGGMKAMQVCSGAESGFITPTKMFAGGSSCEGGNRRMSSSTNTIHYATSVSGSATVLAAKEKAVKAKIAAIEATADKTEAKATTVKASETVAAGCVSVSLSLGILVLSFIASCAM